MPAQAILTQDDEVVEVGDLDIDTLISALLDPDARATYAPTMNHTSGTLSSPAEMQAAVTTMGAGNTESPTQCGCWGSCNVCSVICPSQGTTNCSRIYLAGHCVC